MTIRAGFARFLVFGWALLTSCATTPIDHESRGEAPADCGAKSTFARATPAESARAWIAACGPDATVDLTRKLVTFQTVGAEIPAASSPAFAAMADYLALWAQERGLRFGVVGEHDAWEVSYGKGRPRLGFVMHADVVPVRAESEDRSPLGPGIIPEGWSRPPFEATVDGGRLYGRGTEDDKGPIAAALIVLQALAMYEVPTSGPVVVIMGTGEESDWSGMRRYIKARPIPQQTISVDASFPVVVAESGFVTWKLQFALQKPSGSGATISELKAGQFLTQVPGEARMVVNPAPGEDPTTLLRRARAGIEAAVKLRGADFGGSATLQKGQVVINTTGRAVHSSTADEGGNALWLLADVAHHLALKPGGPADLLSTVRALFAGDHHGEKLGISHAHPLMGKLLVTPTMARLDGTHARLSVNLRRPAGPSNAEFGALLDQALTKIRDHVGSGVEEAKGRYIGDPALADGDKALIRRLTAIYRSETGHDAPPISIRGGTYARLFPGAVSFGPSMPGRPYSGHAPDEFIELETLHRVTRMLAEAAIQLAGASP